MEEDDDRKWLEEAEVMSEVHVGCNPSLGSGVSVFAISSSSACTGGGYREENIVQKDENCESADQISVGTDEHGDFILPRRKRRREPAEVRGSFISVHHHLSTRLPDVGLQVWKGALLLSDFILHEMSTRESFRDAVAMELGAGTGLVGLIMARFARFVFITDRGTDILDNCKRNVVTNSSSLKYGESGVRVRELDWHKPWSPRNEGSSDCSSTYQWTPDDIRIAGEVSVLLAADVVYSPDLTDALFNLLKELMPLGSKKILYLAMEKRYNFSLSDRDVVAHDYEHFRSFFTDDSKEENCEEIEVGVDSSRNVRHFRGRKIDVSEVRQYLLDYDRGNDLELWEIRSKHS